MTPYFLVIAAAVITMAVLIVSHLGMCRHDRQQNETTTHSDDLTAATQTPKQS